MDEPAHRNGIAGHVIAVIADTFDIDPASVLPSTVADDVDGWDSLGHSVLIVRLSRRLGIEIDDWTASELRSVGHMIDVLQPLCRKA